jgi:hypothetical protein
MHPRVSVARKFRQKAGQKPGRREFGLVRRLFCRCMRDLEAALALLFKRLDRVAGELAQRAQLLSRAVIHSQLTHRPLWTYRRAPVES